MHKMRAMLYNWGRQKQQNVQHLQLEIQQLQLNGKIIKEQLATPIMVLQLVISYGVWIKHYGNNLQYLVTYRVMAKKGLPSYEIRIEF